jgi:hypothetical protein
MSEYKYGEYSPYKNTELNDFYLDVWTPREITLSVDDTLVELPSQYEYRPDLLANDAYGDPKLWWVFAMRNPEVIKDPIYDLVAGIKIYIPQRTQLFKDLGVV